MYYLFTKVVLIGHSELGCSVTLGTSSINFILFICFFLQNLQIAQGQVKETVAEVIGVSEIHDT